ncbi:unnamed protein product [Miscanthus lutarioriparius]|uniref:Phytocyanin domain-containing protein n=1 Tax=Miscanthus lutarioriparius TaxID=422564 RepID=A0A811PXS6_9POAL|nr:unnamed protein product [Miscanthus lutarioriparius]
MAAAPPMTSSRRLFALAAVFVLAACCLPAAAAAPQGKQYRVGGEDGWRVPPPEGEDKYYDNWASNITFYVDDSLEFVYKNDSVLRVSKAGYYHCNETAGDAAPRDGRTVFLLDAPGYAYFASADLQHCGMGERLAVSVLTATAGLPAPAPSPSSPWSSSAPGPWSWVLSPSSSAPSPSGEHSAAAAMLVASSSAQAVVLVVAVALALAMAAGFV